MISSILAAVALAGMALAVWSLRSDAERALTPLVERAVSRLPAALQSRYADEWRADLAALSARPLAALVWALGLQRASLRLAREPGRARVPVARAAQIVLDAGALAFAYYAAFSLRFGAGIPQAYEHLLRRTLPAAVAGGLLCLALAGAYAPRVTAAKVAGGVGLTTLVVVAYVALAQPVLISSARGLTALTVPAGVCAGFALSAGLLLLVSRTAVAIAVRS